MLKTWPNPIFEKIFFPAENTGNMPEIAVFHRTFSLYFVVFFYKNINDIAFSFVRSFVRSFPRSFVRSFLRSFLRSFVRSFLRSYFHYQVGPISMWLVFF